MRRAVPGLFGVLLAAMPAACAADGDLQIDGYLQARVVVTERPSVYPYNGSTFLVRRARLRFQHSVGIARAVIQIDGVASGKLASDGTTPQIVRDAYIQLPFGRAGQAKPFTLWAGQFKVPFGYTVLASSKDRLFPERPVGFEYDGAGGLPLFPTVRDRGVRLTYQAGKATGDLAVVNGGGINLPVSDPDNGKDLYGRVDYRFGSVGAVASGRVGSQAFSGVVRQRSVWGLGVSVNPLLAGDLTAEFVTGRQSSTAANRTTPQAWYVQYLHRFGREWRAGVRYAAWDPDIKNSGVPSNAGEERGPGLVIAYEPDSHLRLTGAVEAPLVVTATGRKSATVGVGQIQYAF